MTYPQAFVILLIFAALCMGVVTVVVLDLNKKAREKVEKRRAAAAARDRAVAAINSTPDPVAPAPVSPTTSWTVTSTVEMGPDVGRTSRRRSSDQLFEESRQQLDRMNREMREMSEGLFTQARSDLDRMSQDMRRLTSDFNRVVPPRMQFLGPGVQVRADSPANTQVTITHTVVKKEEPAKVETPSRFDREDPV